MKRLKEYLPPGIAAAAVLVILATAFLAAVTGPTPTVRAKSTQDDWTQGYDQGHTEGACVALTGAVGCDWTTVAVCQDGVTQPCVTWLGDAVTVHLRHVCPWLPRATVCVDDRDH